ncbi:EamA family transporter [Paenibacillus sp. FA6]|uniref:EamA family transporter n=1 Tax=Paenibacillus sp. FA6 TaxID=3413029 RepID=UPI003F658873
MNLLKYSIFVILGAISYGTLSTMIKLGFEDGFTSGELVGSQYFVGWVIIAAIYLFSFNYKISWKNAGQLLITGTLTALVGITYAVSVSELPASIAVVFLFQFTWIGVVIESVLTRTWPSKSKLVAILLLVIGTLLAGAIFGQSLASLSMKGVLFGLLAALFFAMYLVLTSRVATHEAAPKRLFFISTGALLVISLSINPIHLVSQLTETSLWSYGLLLGVFGVVVPFLLFAISMPKIGAGLGTILCAAELPSAMVVSVIILGELVTPLQWIGMILIVLGIMAPEIMGRISFGRKSDKRLTPSERHS